MIRLLPLPFVVLLALIPATAPGCAIALHDGENLGIASESAIIIWDEANQMEHFYRRAMFLGSAYDFGFLVPTPTKPEIEETQIELFGRMEKLTKPRVEERTRTASIGCSMAAMKSASAPDEAAAGLMILQELKIGDHDVVSIKFDRTKGDTMAGAAELANWLVRFGYGFGDNLKEWIQPYVQKDWVITAFRIAGHGTIDNHPAQGATGRGRRGNPAGNHDMQAKPVRMSFKTDRPFYPYREPSDQRSTRGISPPRLLRVFFVAEKRYQGILGDTKAWPGQTVWADKMKEVEKVDFASQAKVKLDTIPGEWFVTEFDDRSSPRPGTDEVYFSPSPDQSTVAKPPIINWKEDETPWIIGLGICFGLPAVTFLLIAIIRKRRAVISS